MEGEGKEREGGRLPLHNINLFAGLRLIEFCIYGRGKGEEEEKGRRGRTGRRGREERGKKEGEEEGLYTCNMAFSKEHHTL